MYYLMQLKLMLVERNLKYEYFSLKFRNIKKVSLKKFLKDRKLYP